MFIKQCDSLRMMSSRHGLSLCQQVMQLNTRFHHSEGQFSPGGPSRRIMKVMKMNTAFDKMWCICEALPIMKCVPCTRMRMKNNIVLHPHPFSSNKAKILLHTLLYKTSPHANMSHFEDGNADFSSPLRAIPGIAPRNTMKSHMNIYFSQCTPMDTNGQHETLV